MVETARKRFHDLYAVQASAVREGDLIAVVDRDETVRILATLDEKPDRFVPVLDVFRANDVSWVEIGVRIGLFATDGRSSLMTADGTIAIPEREPVLVYRLTE